MTYRVTGGVGAVGLGVGLVAAGLAAGLQDMAKRNRARRDEYVRQAWENYCARQRQETADQREIELAETMRLFVTRADDIRSGLT